MQKAFKYRIYPNKDQIKFLSNQFGAVRFVYNYFLANRKSEYLNNKKSLSYYDDAKLLTELKNTDGYDWLYNINAQTLQGSLRNLEVAYQGFFLKRTGFPKFHAKKNKQCIKIPQAFSIEDNKLYIPKLKTGIDIVLHRELPAKQTCCFISKTCSNKYYVSFLCDIKIDPLKANKKKIGIDLGINSLVVSSDGKEYENKRHYVNLESKLAYEQRQLSKKSGKAKEKQRIIVAKINEYIANSRKDYLHKVSREIINDNQVVIAESLSVKNMMKNHKLAKHIQDASWSELTRQLEYKSNWYGRTFYQIDRFFPSSKTCNNCQFVVDDLRLSIREWQCSSCNHHNNRDINAAKNIRDKGLKDLKEQVKISSGLGNKSDIKQKLIERSSKKTR
jgi:putative transposase